MDVDDERQRFVARFLWQVEVEFLCLITTVDVGDVLLPLNAGR
jgi:hypothetical protein